LLLQNTFELFEGAHEICCCVAQALSISSRSWLPLEWQHSAVPLPF
jgi:hypothetical protein